MERGVLVAGGVGAGGRLRASIGRSVGRRGGGGAERGRRFNSGLCLAAGGLYNTLGALGLVWGLGETKMKNLRALRGDQGGAGVS